jgi:hypothetical protein
MGSGTTHLPLKIPRMGSGTRQLPPQNPPNGLRHEAASPSKSPKWVGHAGHGRSQVPEWIATRRHQPRRCPERSLHADTSRAVARNGSVHADTSRAVAPNGSVHADTGRSGARNGSVHAVAGRSDARNGRYTPSPAAPAPGTVGTRDRQPRRCPEGVGTPCATPFPASGTPQGACTDLFGAFFTITARLSVSWPTKEAADPIEIPQKNEDFQSAVQTTWRGLASAPVSVPVPVPVSVPVSVRPTEPGNCRAGPFGVLAALCWSVRSNRVSHSYLHPANRLRGLASQQLSTLP